MQPKKLLFVCLGNICRSPMAEAVMKHIVSERGMADRFHIDSAGIIGYHEGEPADPRMRNFAFQRGYRVTSISRPVSEADFRNFDLIIGMDHSNMDALRRKQPADSHARLALMTDFCRTSDADVVPDPYYGGASGFSLVIDILEDACEGLYQLLTQSEE